MQPLVALGTLNSFKDTCDITIHWYLITRLSEYTRHNIIYTVDICVKIKVYVVVYEFELIFRALDWSTYPTESSSGPYIDIAMWRFRKPFKK